MPATLDPLFTALGDRTDRTILTRLARGDTSVSALAAPLAMTLPPFAQHLRKLEAAGLITTKAGRIWFCALPPGAFAPLDNQLRAQRDIWNRRLDRFNDYVGALKKIAGNATGPHNGPETCRMTVNPSPSAEGHQTDRKTMTTAESPYK